MKKMFILKKSILRVLFLLLLLTSLNLNLKSQNITVTDDDGYTADPSAMLDIKSETKGLLIPRISTANRTALASTAVDGLLVFDSDESVFYYYDGSAWINLSKGQIWTVNSEYVILSNENGKVGIGTSTPNSKLEVQADASFTESDTLFAVKDKNGNIVFAVFPDGAKVYVNAGAKGTVGGFAVSGRNPAKATVEENYLKVTPDSTRIWVNEAAKGTVGGFAVSGRNPAKSTILNYFVSTADSTRVYINEGAKGTVGGFAVSGRNPAKGITDNYMEVTKDSTRIYVTEDVVKGTVGGFAVSGRNPAKGGITNDYFNVSGNTSATEINNEARIMWYPQKAALLAGEVHVGSADSVGTNSVALGYRTISKGDYSQAFGYKSKSYGENSTAIGKNAQALGPNSFALGDSAIARGNGSYAFGTTGLDTLTGEPTIMQTVANGDHSFAFGFGAYADTAGSFAIGTEVAALGQFSLALGLYDTSYADFSYAIGLKSITRGEHSGAFGTFNEAIGRGSFAIGSGCTSVAAGDFTIGTNSYASGGGAFAIGVEDTATSPLAFAVGYRTMAKNVAATAFGTGTTSSGMVSTAFGSGTTASGSYSTAMGLSTLASGSSSTAIGYSSIASGNISTAMGYSTTASGSYSTAMGYRTTASGDYSTAIGREIESSGLYSIAIALNDQNGTDVTANNVMAIMGGNVGIGTIAPEAPLDIETNSSGYALHLEEYGSYTEDWQIGVDASGDLNFFDGTVNRITFEDGGNVGIGIENPTAELDIVHGNTGTLSGLKLKNSTTTDTWRLYVSSSAGALRLYSNYDTGYRGQFHDETGVYSSVSDKRLKDNINTIPDVLDKVNKLNVVDYYFISDKDRKQKSMGLIAQDVEKLFPSLVVKPVESKEEETSFYTMNYSGFGVIAIKAIQEQQSIIESQEVKIKNLEQQNIDLIKRLENLERLILK